MLHRQPATATWHDPQKPTVIGRCLSDIKFLTLMSLNDASPIFAPIQLLETIDLAHMKTAFAAIAPVIAVAGKGPEFMKLISRWIRNRPREKEAAISRAMKRFALYDKSPVALRADTLRDLLFAAFMFLGFVLTLAMALSPSHRASDLAASVFLAIEGFVMILICAYALNRTITRLSQASDPHRTMLKYQLQLMRARLERAEADLARLKGPLLPKEDE